MTSDDYLITTYSNRPHTAAQFFEDHKKSYIMRKEIPETSVRPNPFIEILIPSCKKHKESTELLCRELDRQKLHYIVDDREDIDLGTKRQELYQKAQYEYCVQWDADDWIAGDFGDVIYKALYNAHYNKVDCVNFLEHVVMGDKKTLTRRSINFPWSGMMLPGNQYAFSPNTKSIVRTELARQVKFEKGHQGEDLAFGRDLRPLLKSEINLDYIGYFYEYTSEGTATSTNEHQVGK